jgi:hypothetical protein
VSLVVLKALRLVVEMVVEWVDQRALRKDYEMVY